MKKHQKKKIILFALIVIILLSCKKTQTANIYPGISGMHIWSGIEILQILDSGKTVYDTSNITYQQEFKVFSSTLVGYVDHQGILFNVDSVDTLHYFLSNNADKTITFTGGNDYKGYAGSYIFEYVVDSVIYYSNDSMVWYSYKSGGLNEELILHTQ